MNGSISDRHWRQREVIESRELRLRLEDLNSRVHKTERDEGEIAHLHDFLSEIRRKVGQSWGTAPYDDREVLVTAYHWPEYVREELYASVEAVDGTDWEIDWPSAFKQIESQYCRIRIDGDIFYAFRP